MIRINQIKKSYGTHENRALILKGISTEIEDGDFVVILGASGSGKSTLLNVISGLEQPDSGSVTYDGTDITAFNDRELTAFRRENVGFIFQQYYLLPNLTVEKNVRMGADLAGNSDYRSVLKAVGLENKLKKYPGELSGGEQQRVAVARKTAAGALSRRTDRRARRSNRTSGARLHQPSAGGVPLHCRDGHTQSQHCRNGEHGHQNEQRHDSGNLHE